MKSLLEIQQEIHDLEKNIQNISRDIKLINADIDELRGEGKESILDFSMIEILSHQIKFGKHPLYKLEDGRLCQIYLEILINMVRLDEDYESTLNRMVFVQWLQSQANIDWSLEKLFMNSYYHRQEDIYYFVTELSEKYKESFVLDLLIVGNITGYANRDIQEYIVNMSALLGVDKDRFKLLVNVAKLVLCQSFKDVPQNYSKSVLDEVARYKHYISKDIITSGQSKTRVIVLEKPDNVLEFKWKVNQNQIVDVGDVIASYRKKRGRTEYISSSASGKLYQFKYDHKYYGVVSYDKDNKDAIKYWVKNGGK